MKGGWAYKIELSALLTILGIILLFSVSVAIVLIAPSYIDKSWTMPTSSYQVQVYELADPHVFISGVSPVSQEVAVVNHLQAGFSLLAFRESETVRIQAASELENYVTRQQDPLLKLTTRLLLLRPLALNETKATYQLFELYDPHKEEAFAIGSSDTHMENWVDKDYTILDPKLPWHTQEGVIFYHNPIEYLVKELPNGEWQYDPNGRAIAHREELKSKQFGFLSRQELIQKGEEIYAIEGCWYCHTDQTRTLVQDLVLNGSAAYPAPPSSANEYIYQKITFPGTKRNGPDLSRVGVKRPSRDWHKAHFWSPKSQSAGSIMPAFAHFFDFDPRGTGVKSNNIPNYRFEAVFQYLMTKGTRITPPTEAWWLGKDPLKVKEILEGKRLEGKVLEGKGQDG